MMLHRGAGAVGAVADRIGTRCVQSCRIGRQRNVFVVPNGLVVREIDGRVRIGGLLMRVVGLLMRDRLI